MDLLQTSTGPPHELLRTSTRAVLDLFTGQTDQTGLICRNCCKISIRPPPNLFQTFSKPPPELLRAQLDQTRQDWSAEHITKISSDQAASFCAPRLVESQACRGGCCIPAGALKTPPKKTKKQNLNKIELQCVTVTDRRQSDRRKTSEESHCL